MAVYVIYDVTDQVAFQRPDDESLPLMKCVCGRVIPAWDTILHGDVTEMSCCGARLKWTQRITVWQEKPGTPIAAMCSRCTGNGYNAREDTCSACGGTGKSAGY